MADSTARDAFLSQLSSGGPFSDFTIVCRESRFPVHRLVLGLHSEVLGKACNGNFKIRTFETTDCAIDLSEYTVAEIQALVDYMYDFDYTTPPPDLHDLADGLIFHVRLLLIADKYAIKGLQTLATKRFIHHFPTNDIQVLAEVAQLTYAFPTVTSTLNVKIVGSIVQNKKCLEEDSTLTEVMAEHPQFAIDIARALANDQPHPPRPTYCRCPNCNCKVDIKSCMGAEDHIKMPVLLGILSSLRVDAGDDLG